MNSLFIIKGIVASVIAICWIVGSFRRRGILYSIFVVEIGAFLKSPYGPWGWAILGFFSVYALGLLAGLLLLAIIALSTNRLGFRLLEWALNTFTVDESEVDQPPESRKTATSAKLHPSRFDLSDTEAVAFCPECRAGFRLGIIRCVACDVELVPRDRIENIEERPLTTGHLP